MDTPPDMRPSSNYILNGFVLIMCPFVSRPRNFMNKVQRACIMFLKETKPFMI